MKERPILFSAPMVRAILEGRKTQTRRVIKDQSIGERYCGPCEDGSVLLEWLGTPCCGSGAWDEPEYSAKATSPYGKIGDRLWVRETWRGIVQVNAPYEDFRLGIARYIPEQQYCRRVEYAATQDDCTGAWRPSIHMPRWASRILLEVVSVRVERLRGISEADAKAEGVTYEPMIHSGYVGAFCDLWSSINGPESWDANPWVWVVEFRRVQA